jgi:hypothetical protein
MIPSVARCCRSCRCSTSSSSRPSSHCRNWRTRDCSFPFLMPTASKRRRAVSYLLHPLASRSAWSRIAHVGRSVVRSASKSSSVSGESLRALASLGRRWGWGSVSPASQRATVERSTPRWKAKALLGVARCATHTGEAATAAVLAVGGAAHDHVSQCTELFTVGSHAGSVPQAQPPMRRECRRRATASASCLDIGGFAATYPHGRPVPNVHLLATPVRPYGG